MTTLNQTFSIATRTIAAVEHPMLRRANLGFTLNQPFAWSLINTAAVLARMLDEHGYVAEQLESEHVRDDILASDMNVERIDQLVIKMATLRHFNRIVCGSNDIGIGSINACLRLDNFTVSLEDIKQTARDRIKIERRMGKLKPTGVAARFNELVTGMFEAEVARKRQTKRLMTEVFLLCNRSDDMLFTRQFEHQLDAHTSYSDAELADFNAFEHLGEALAEKCVEPVIRARSEIQSLMDRSYRSNVLAEGTALMKELDKLATELGINFAKIDAQNASIDAEIAAAEHMDQVSDAEIDALDLELPNTAETELEELAPKRERRTVKSEARLAREQADAEAAQQRAEYEAATAAKAAKAKATRQARAAAAASTSAA